MPDDNPALDDNPAPTDNPVLRVSDIDGVRVLTFNRPDKMNAFDEALWHGFADALLDAQDDPTINVVVVTGTGRAFTAGQDLGLLTGADTLEPGAEPGFNRLMPVLEVFSKPLIAAVNGVGVGFGLTLLLHCDLVYMGETAKVKVPFLSLGVTTEAASSVLLPSIVGAQRAAEIVFTEPWIDADQAVADGLALKVCPDDQLMVDTMATATTIAAFPQNAIVATKQLLVAGRIDSIRAARSREDDAFEHLVRAMQEGT